MEGETEMKPFFNIPEDQWMKLKTVAVAYVIWTLISGIAYAFFLPNEWKWVAYGPLAFLMIVVVSTSIAIISRPFIPRPIEAVYVGRRRVSCCQFCPMADIKDNIINSGFPVVKCRETAKVCYAPMKIPRWCPYALEE